MTNQHVACVCDRTKWLLCFSSLSPSLSTPSFFLFLVRACFLLPFSCSSSSSLPLHLIERMRVRSCLQTNNVRCRHLFVPIKINTIGLHERARSTEQQQQGPFHKHEYKKAILDDRIGMSEICNWWKYPTMVPFHGPPPHRSSILF